MIFINTRPESRAKSLTDFLQSQDVNVLELPLLELVKCELSQQEEISLENLTQANFYKALVFISETAAHYFSDFIQTHNIQLSPNLTFIAVGQKTAETLKNLWQKISDIPSNFITPSQFNLPENNQGLLQLPIIQSLQKNDKVLILKGNDGQAAFKNRLLEKNIQVDEVDFYRRIFPAKSAIIFQHFCPTFSQKTLVLITSLTAWQHWRTLCEKYAIDIGQFFYLVLQSRIFQHIAKQLPTQNLVQINDLLPETIFIALQNFAYPQTS